MTVLDCHQRRNSNQKSFYASLQNKNSYLNTWVFICINKRKSNPRICIVYASYIFINVNLSVNVIERLM